MLPWEDPGLSADVGSSSPWSVLNELLHSEQAVSLSESQGNGTAAGGGLVPLSQSSQEKSAAHTSP